jgi:hypothetical protein
MYRSLVITVNQLRITRPNGLRVDHTRKRECRTRNEEHSPAIVQLAQGLLEKDAARMLAVVDGEAAAYGAEEDGGPGAEVYSPSEHDIDVLRWAMAM